MKIMFRVLTALIIALLVGCASTPPVYPTAFQSIPRDELNRYFDAKKVGMVLLVADKKLDKKLIPKSVFAQPPSQLFFQKTAKIAKINK